MRKRRKRRTHVVTDCGHPYNTGHTASRLAGCTTDCPTCGQLLIFPRKATVGSCVRARKFHVYMHETNPDWPIDGQCAGWVEF